MIGPNAEQVQLMGGGSASLAPHYRISPLEALRERLGDRHEIVFERGCDINRATPALGGPRVTTPGGTPGIAVELFANAEFLGEPRSGTREEGNVVILGDLGGANAEPMSMRSAPASPPTRPAPTRSPSPSSAGRAAPSSTASSCSTA